MSGPVGVEDDDGWIEYWLSLHPTTQFAEAFNALVLSRLWDRDPPVASVGGGMTG